MSFENSFMKPQVFFGGYFEVETTGGTEIVISELVSQEKGVDIGVLIPFLEGEPWNKEEWIKYQEGYLARMSAPGYLDCTAYSAHKTEQDAIEYLEQMYGEE